MTEKMEPLILQGVKTPINFDIQKSKAFPMMRRSTDFRVFSSKAIAECPITKAEVEELKNDLQKKETVLKLQFDQIRKEHIAYVAEMEIKSLAKDKKIAELQSQIDETMKTLANREQVIIFQKELIRKKDEKIEKQIKEFTKTIARIVHDLKSPLTGIKSSADVLSEFSFSEDAKTLLNIIVSASNDLTEMVEDILLTNKLTHNAITLDKKTFSLTAKVRELVEQNQEYSKKIRKRIDFKSDGDILIHADELKIKRAIGNLISNALKYGNTSVMINIYETPNNIALDIIDDGKGFDEEVRKKIFSNTEMATTDLINGNGFGLTNAKKLIELHGGKINLAEESQKGTKFMIRFAKV